MINASGEVQKIIMEFNVYGYGLWLCILLWINIKFHGSVLMLRYKLEV
jgi:hypothetical protein